MAAAATEIYTLSLHDALPICMIRQTEARLRERNRELQELSRQVERLAVIEERDRLAREMHDSVAQVLAYLLVRLRSEEHTSELQSRRDLVCRLLLEKKKNLAR